MTAQRRLDFPRYTRASLLRRSARSTECGDRGSSPCGDRGDSGPWLRWSAGPRAGPPMAPKPLPMPEPFSVGTKPLKCGSGGCSSGDSTLRKQRQ